MADFLRTTANDWDLEAIIRGWGGGNGGSSSCTPPPLSPFLGFDGFEFEAEDARGVVNELEELYKPFVVQVEQTNKHESPRCSQTETGSPCSSSLVMFDHDDDVEKPKEEVKGSIDHLEKLVEDHTQARSSSKRRKSKQKIVRVVHKGVGEDGVLMDKWNWRKYGQKAIKGSPHPRSYYRCSSSGGCHARKHVEQSKENPDTCIVTYIADHTHSPPTRRHAQAGRKITKFSSSSATARVINKNTTHKTSPCSTSTMSTWTVSDPMILEDGDDKVALGLGGSIEGDESCGLGGVMKDLFSTSTSFDQDWCIWEFDPFFSTYVI